MTFTEHYVLTNDNVQSTFFRAIEKLAETTPPSDFYLLAQFELARNTLILAQGYTASGNDIPCKGGQGLIELLDFAGTIINEDFNFNKMQLDFKHLALSFI